jgi:hypothetical protein
VSAAPELPARELVSVVSAMDPDLGALLDDAVRTALSPDGGGSLVAGAFERVRVLLGDEVSPRPPRSPAATACVALAEQFSLDVSAVSDGDVAAVQAHLEPAELYGFVASLYALEMTRRVEIALHAVLDEARR